MGGDGKVRGAGIEDEEGWATPELSSRHCIKYGVLFSDCTVVICGLFSKGRPVAEIPYPLSVGSADLLWVCRDDIGVEVGTAEQT